MLKLDEVSKVFEGKTIFENISFILNDGEKLGLIGRNGSGKSTILKIIAGKLPFDGGNIITSKNYRIGYLEQHLLFREKTLLAEACLALPDYRSDNYWEAEKILHDMGFSTEDATKAPEEFSGGWQMRLNFAKLLISEPDLLLLDEPTNYLDILSIRWLKKFLISWKKSLIVVTHDKNFLNEVTECTVIIHRGISKKIIGHADDMYRQIREKEENYEKTRINENKKREQTQKYIDRFRYKATLATRVQSKIKMLARQDEKQELSSIDKLEFEFAYKNIISNKPFVEIANLKFGYENGKTLIGNLSFKIEKGDKICVVGKNGTGKSTLLRLIANELSPNAGKISFCGGIGIGYFGQMNIGRLNLENSVEEELSSVDPKIHRSKILNVAGLMMFGGDDHRKKIAVLSGGERSRVLLGKIILQQCNLLLLDEPTNHLDMESCDSLAEAVNNFPGASVTVTHDESFLNTVANRLIVFDDQKVFVFDSVYRNFLNEIGYSSEKS
ncbi:MAG: ATP-binding cassette domain-containing protein [Rickettsiales bacterium]|jgi:ATP-binding cassette subfamily F protein 3|nr:ATP-binding cassette domain-containing protein [Rickettsiales bacterium]